MRALLSSRSVRLFFADFACSFLYCRAVDICLFIGLFVQLDEATKYVGAIEGARVFAWMGSVRLGRSIWSSETFSRHTVPTVAESVYLFGILP